MSYVLSKNLVFVLCLNKVLKLMYSLWNKKLKLQLQMEWHVPLAVKMWSEPINII